MLNEASRLHQPEVFQFVLGHKYEMPRTALRYAIELMPDEMRKTAMLKDW
jgi:3-methyladenine DNA glycosylase AlkD